MPSNDRLVPGSTLATVGPVVSTVTGSVISAYWPTHGVKRALTFRTPSARPAGAWRATVAPAVGAAAVASNAPSPSKSTWIVPYLLGVTSTHGRVTLVMSSLADVPESLPAWRSTVTAAALAATGMPALVHVPPPASALPAWSVTAAPSMRSW